jgi:hypothetical protein
LVTKTLDTDWIQIGTYSYYAGSGSVSNEYGSETLG